MGRQGWDLHDVGMQWEGVIPYIIMIIAYQKNFTYMKTFILK